MSHLTAAGYARGALYGLAAVSIWSGWIVVARLGLATGLTPWDMAALRFAVSGVLLAPYLLRKGLALERLGWRGLAAIVLGGGAPVLFANAGLLFAPAAQAGALLPGATPLMVAMLAAIVLHEAFTSTTRVGFALIVVGVVGIACGADATLRPNIGHVLFLGAALGWASFTVAMRQARLGGLHAAAIAAVGALVLYLPVYLLVAGAGILEAPADAVVLQAMSQGLLTAIVALLLYGRAIGILGAASGAAFAALCPALTALMAIAILGERPAATDWIAIIVISVGIYVMSGGPMPRRRK